MRKAKTPAPHMAQPASPVLVEIGRSGDSMPAEELREAARQVLAEGKDIALNFHDVNHLDASLLQILLALQAEQTKQQRRVDLLNVSPSLRQWFDYSGATDNFFPDPTDGR